MATENEQGTGWDSNGFNIYAESDYHYDDAALLAKLWDIPVAEAKQAIGHKITHQIEHLLPAEVQASYQEHRNEGDFHYTSVIEERPALIITGKDYKLQARIIWSDERPASNLSVKVYDQDLFNDDFLGKTITADNGGFELTFNEKDFKGLFDSKPDLYFVIANEKGEVLFNSKEFVIKNADEKTTPITLVLD